MATEQITVGELIDRFLAHVRRELAIATYRHYRGRLAQFAAAFESRSLADLGASELLDHFEAAGTGKSADTRRADRTAAKRLVNFAGDRQLIDRDERRRLLEILKGVPTPGSRRRERLPTKSEADRITEAGSPEFRLIFTVLRYSGARPGELTGAQIAEWDRDAAVIVRYRHKTVRKTGKPRKIPVHHPKAIESLTAAIGDRTAGPIFLTPRQKPWKVSHLSTTFRRLRRALELDERIVLYSTRHDFATRLAKVAPLHVVKDALGHANITTTQRYCHASDDEIQRAVDSIE